MGNPEAEFQRLFPNLNSRLVTDGYFTAHCTSLGGLQHELGFHFHPRRGGRLVELEFFRRAYTDLAASYRGFQEHLENSFGQPTDTSPGSTDFPSNTWRLSGADVVHFVIDRFGPEKHVGIKSNALTGFLDDPIRTLCDGGPHVVKTLLLFLALSPLVAADKTPELLLTARTKVGAVTLDPGTYQVKVQGSLVFFTDAAGKSVSTVARVEKLPKKASGSAVLGETVDGRYQAISIVFADSDVRLGF